MAQGHRTPCLGHEDGLHAKGEVGLGWPQNSKMIWSLFARVVLRESVRITFIYTALNGLDVCAANIHNACLQAPYSERDYIICSPEFGVENVGRVALIQKAFVWQQVCRQGLQEPSEVLHAPP